MPTLRFRMAEVEKLMNHAESCDEWFMGFEDDLKPQPGLQLVGDSGVYLMSNGRPHLPREGEPDAHHVVYAQGINPNVDDFDTWWSNKNATFGGDDGAEMLCIIPQLRTRQKRADRLEWLEIEMTPTQIAILDIEPAP